jgi:hypothetical protein
MLRRLRSRSVERTGEDDTAPGHLEHPSIACPFTWIAQRNLKIAPGWLVGDAGRQ